MACQLKDEILAYGETALLLLHYTLLRHDTACPKEFNIYSLANHF